jgi:uncharacterized membrane protein YfcA
LQRVSRRFIARRKSAPGLGSEAGAPLAESVRMFALGAIVALAIGLSLGLLGAGGSILTVPVFRYLFGLDAHDAIASALIVVALTGAFALVPHARAGRVHWRAGLVMGIASVTAAYLGGRASAGISGVALMVAFALVMLAAGLAMVLRRSPAPRSSGDVQVLRFLAIGLGVGFLTGVLGAGGGFLLVPALVLVGRLSMQHAVGTSLFLVVLNALAATAGAATHAPPKLGLVVPVAGVAIIGSLAGARLGGRLSATQLQRGFGGFVIVIGLAILTGELL